MSIKKKYSSTNIRNWKFEADDRGVLVRRHPDENLERLLPDELVGLISSLRSECLKHATEPVANKEGKDDGKESKPLPKPPTKWQRRTNALVRKMLIKWIATAR